MTSFPDDKFERGLATADDESGSSDKGNSQQLDVDSKAAPAVALGERAFAAPEWIRNLTPEERKSVEGKLKRKLDTRLMPMIVLMYIMNYLDRVSLLTFWIRFGSW
jgi:hypothetical protein